jgi:hypothetical protein
MILEQKIAKKKKNCCIKKPAEILKKSPACEKPV